MSIALAGCVVLCRIAFTLPRDEDSDDTAGLGEQLRIIRRLPVSLGLAANCVLMTGSTMMLTYLGPYLSATTTSDITARAISFSFSGFAGMIGIWCGGIATDSLGADRTLLIGIGTIIASMLALWILWLERPASPPLVIAIVCLWGAMAFGNSPAIQARLYHLAGPASEQALALNTSGSYLRASFAFIAVILLAWAAQCSTQHHRADWPPLGGQLKNTHPATQSMRSRVCVYLVELTGLEPVTPTLPVWCATSCAIAPWTFYNLHSPVDLKQISCSHPLFLPAARGG